MLYILRCREITTHFLKIVVLKVPSPASAAWVNFCNFSPDQFIFYVILAQKVNSILYAVCDDALFWCNIMSRMLTASKAAARLLVTYFAVTFCCSFSLIVITKYVLWKKTYIIFFIVRCFFAELAHNKIFPPPFGIQSSDKTPMVKQVSSSEDVPTKS